MKKCRLSGHRGIRQWESGHQVIRCSGKPAGSARLTIAAGIGVDPSTSSGRRPRSSAVIDHYSVASFDSTQDGIRGPKNRVQTVLIRVVYFTLDIKGEMW
ncbi:MAG: hypothetical protein ACYS6W_18315 [Planctomycetota bacterium]